MWLIPWTCSSYLKNKVSAVDLRLLLPYSRYWLFARRVMISRTRCLALHDSSLETKYQGVPLSFIWKYENILLLEKETYKSC